MEREEEAGGNNQVPAQQPPWREEPRRNRRRAAGPVAADDEDDEDDQEDERPRRLAVADDEEREAANFEEDDEIELHIAMDELLGLRGPLVNVARNVSWLVVFNAAYLGVFAFVPFAVGSMVTNVASSAHHPAIATLARLSAGFAAAWAERRAGGASVGAAFLAAAAAAGRRATETSELVAVAVPGRRLSYSRWAAAAGRLALAVASRAASVVDRRSRVVTAAAANATDPTALSTEVAFVDALGLGAIGNIGTRLDALARSALGVILGLGAAWGRSPSERRSTHDAAPLDGPPPPTLRLDDLLKMGVGYLALGLVACAWRAALEAAPSWLRRRAPPRALRRAEKALDAAAAAAKVTALLALKMVLLPSVLGAGLDAALSSHAIFKVQTRTFPLLVDQPPPKLFTIHAPLADYLAFDAFTQSFYFEHQPQPPTHQRLQPQRNATPMLGPGDRPANDDDQEEIVLPAPLSDGAEAARECAAERQVRETVSSANADSGSRDELAVARLSPRAEGVAAAVRELGGGALGVALCRWVLGISFMLVVTVAVLQLREVLHPAVLARHVRPHQHRPDLLATLLAEPAKAHAKRLGTSLAIYGALLAVAVAAPALAYSAVASRFLPASASASLFVARFCYVLPRAQIPIELVVFHLAVLGLLERLKARLRDALTVWLSLACRQLELDAYLLPRFADPDRTLLRQARADRHLGGDSAPRWAWGDEQPSHRELSLAPRLRPRRFLAARLVVLVASSWIAMVVATALVALGPIALGRAVLDLLRAPQSHDPFALALGWTIILFAFGPWLDDSSPDLAEEPRLRERRDEQPEHVDQGGERRALVADGPQPRMDRRQSEQQRRRRHPRDGDLRALPPADRLVKLGQFMAFMILWFGISPLAVGTLYDVVLVASRDEWAKWQPPFTGSATSRSRLPPLDWGRNWLLGLLVLQTLALAAARVAADDDDADRHVDDGDPNDGAPRRRDDAGSAWPRAALAFRDALSRPGPMREFDPALLYDLAVPVVLDLIDFTLAPVVPTVAAVLVGRWLGVHNDFVRAPDRLAEIGTQMLVVYRYAMAATVATSACLYLVEPIVSW